MSERYKRQCGVLLPLSALPSRQGIGCLGKEAYRFVDALHAAGVSVWQLLPVCPTSYGDSPYQSPSAFAGNPYFIDLSPLAAQGFLRPGEGPDTPPDFPIDYGALYEERLPALKKAFQRGGSRFSGMISRFRRENPWAEDYALYSALKSRFDGAAWFDWQDEALRCAEPQALAAFRQENAALCDLHIFAQALFAKQWAALRRYAKRRGVSLLGDLPIYAALDSADVWAHPELFQLDAARRPTAVAGVPPDYFSKTGQLWGNPLYDWRRMAEDGFAWWRARFARAAALYDAVRLDHFIGYANYYAVPAGAADARAGEWRAGPGLPFFEAAAKSAPSLQIVAEDLGIVNDAVLSLKRRCGFPGMAVLQFAFDGDAESPHLPQNVGENTLYYTSTHDNDTLRGWWQSRTAPQKAIARQLLGLAEGEPVYEALTGAVLRSDARLAVLPVQDLLGLGSEARLNTPGTAEGNWRWRMPPDAMDGALCEKLRSQLEACGRVL